MRLKLVAAIIILTAIFSRFDLGVIWTNIQHQYYKQKNAVTDTGSEVTLFSFTSTVYKSRQKEISIYLPQEYKVDEEKRFPVLYLLHGFPGDNNDWVINANLKNQLDTLISEKVIPPLIVVFPDGNGPIIHDSQYLNATKIEQPAEDFMIEVVNETDARYRTVNSRESRAIGGLSTGAYGAMNIGFHHNDLFGLIISHSGYFMNDEGVTKKLLYPQDVAYNNPLEYIQGQQPLLKTYVYFDIGKFDKESYLSQNKALDEKLSQYGIPHEFKVTEGWHDWEFWRSSTKNSLVFLAKYIKT